MTTEPAAVLDTIVCPCCLGDVTPDINDHTHQLCYLCGCSWDPAAVVEVAEIAKETRGWKALLLLGLVTLVLLLSAAVTDGLQPACAQAPATPEEIRRLPPADLQPTALTIRLHEKQQLL